jgi:hypothetical protein
MVGPPPDAAFRRPLAARCERSRQALETLSDRAARLVESPGRELGCGWPLREGVELERDRARARPRSAPRAWACSTACSSTRPGRIMASMRSHRTCRWLNSAESRRRSSRQEHLALGSRPCGRTVPRPGRPLGASRAGSMTSARKSATAWSTVASCSSSFEPNVRRVHLAQLGRFGKPADGQRLQPSWSRAPPRGRSVRVRSPFVFSTVV